MKKIVLIMILFGLTFSLTWAVPTIDGDLSDAEYTNIAVGNGLGDWGMNVDNIYYYPDATNSILYFGIEGNVATDCANGIGFWLGFNEYDSGLAAGDTLGGTSDGGHYMGNHSGHNQYKADFAVDYMFAMNTGSTSDNMYVDVVKFSSGTGNGQYIGNCGQIGTSTTGPSSDDVFTTNAVTFAFNNDNAANHGFEMSIPFSELGVTSAGLMKAFAFVVSNDAYFCQDCAPGTPPSGDPGFNADYNTLGGGPYSCDWKTLPVELSSFTASYVNEFVTINWQTASETDVNGFNIYRNTEDVFGEASKINIDLIDGHGTTTNMNDYWFTDATADPYYTTYYYWLEAVNLGGTSDVYGSIIYEPRDIDNNGELNIIQSHLSSSYPNPARIGSEIRFNFRVGGMESESRYVELNVYNVVGELVAEIVNGEKMVDDYTEIWKPNNLSNGVYFYQLKTDNYNEVKKMVLVK